MPNVKSMKLPPTQSLARKSARPMFSARILQMVKSVPECNAIVAGEIDAVLDPVARRFFMLPEAQKAQHEEHARICGLLALAADWIWEQDENQCFVSISGVRSAHSAMSPPEIIGKRIWDQPFSSERESELRAHQQQLEWRAPFRDFELSWVPQNGSKHYFSMSGEPVFDAQDRYLGYRGTMVDITQRKMLEAIARRSSDEPVDQPYKERRAPRPQAIPAATGNAAASNLLLAALPAKQARDFASRLEPVSLVTGQVLCERGDRIRHVYFPHDSLVSMMTVLQEHQALEVGLVGREGMAGISLALGIDVSSVRALVRCEGTAMRMNAVSFNEMLDASPQFRSQVLVFADSMLRQASSTAAYGRFHLANARLARWLLMARARLGTDLICLRHADIAETLGLQRTAVTIAANALESKGLIRLERGSIHLDNLRGLEAVADECFAPAEAPPNPQAAS